MSFTELFLAVSPSLAGVVGFVTLMVAVGMSQGKNALISSLIGVYVATLVTAYFPYYDLIESELGISDIKVLKILVFGLFVTGTILSLRKYISNTHQHHLFWRTIEVVVLSIGVVGLTFASLYHVVGIGEHLSFGPMLESLFSSKSSFFFWIIAPIFSFPLFIRP